MQLTDRTTAAEALAYRWACAEIPSGVFKAELGHLGFDIDLRQGDYGAFVEVQDVETGRYVNLEV